MIVLKDKRTLNTEIYDNEDGTLKADFCSGHIAYVNKLKVGDGDDSTLRKISTELLWDEQSRTWYFEYHSFQPSIPEYADDWIEFRDVFKSKDQITKFKPICNHIKGELINNQVIYINAFGQDIDLLVYPERSSLQKVVRFNTVPTEDIDLQFEIDFPNNIIINEHSEDDMATQIWPLTIWDSGELKKQQSISYEIKTILNKQYLIKKVKVAELVGFVAPIMTDTTTSYYSGGGDGQVYKDAAFATSRASATGVVKSAAVGVSIQGQLGWNGYLGRGFCPIVTSAIGATATIISAAFHGRVNAKNLFDHSGDTQAYLAITQSTQTSTSVLATGDYSKITLNSAPKGGTDIRFTAVSVGTDVVWDLNSTGLSWIDKTGATKFCFRTGYDVDNVNYTGASNNGFGFTTSAESPAPHLEVIYTLPSTFIPIITSIF